MAPHNAHTPLITIPTLRIPHGHRIFRRRTPPPSRPDIHHKPRPHKTDNNNNPRPHPPPPLPPAQNLHPPNLASKNLSTYTAIPNTSTFPPTSIQTFHPHPTLQTLATPLSHQIRRSLDYHFATQNGKQCATRVLSWAVISCRWGCTRNGSGVGGRRICVGWEGRGGLWGLCGWGRVRSGGDERRGGLEGQGLGVRVDLGIMVFDCMLSNFADAVHSLPSSIFICSPTMMRPLACPSSCPSSIMSELSSSLFVLAMSSRARSICKS